MSRALLIALLFASSSLWPASAAFTQSNVEITHRALTALYASTNGGGWDNNSGWDTTSVPANMAGFASWRGLWIFRDSLRSIILHNNRLTGSIPAELGNLTDLEILDLDNNCLTGSIPRELGNLVELWSLTLAGNCLTDPIPRELGNLEKLQWLFLNSNFLTGPIPQELSNLAELEGLELGTNSLTGPIPPEFGNLARLRNLSLEHNSLTGSIPSELGNLANLEALGLQHNSLTDPIPLSLSQLQNLGYFHFDDNPGLCAPADAEFQAWLTTIDYVDGPTCNPTVSAEPEGLPVEFAVLPGYPNPFLNSTTIPFDLPWPARVWVEVLDVTGRRVLSMPPSTRLAGQGQEIILRGGMLPPGAYLYRLTASSSEGEFVHTGHFVRVR